MRFQLGDGSSVTDRYVFKLDWTHVQKKLPHSDGVFFTLVTDIQKVYLSVNRPLPERVM